LPRPQCCRHVANTPEHRLFKPAGVPAVELEEVVLGEDELEAIRLADLEGLYQEDAAAHMGISRQTIGRILVEARRKIAETLVQGKALFIQGGNVTMNDKRTFICSACNHTWEMPFGTGRPSTCPKCESHNIQRSPAERGGGTGQMCGRKRCFRGGQGAR